MAVTASIQVSFGAVSADSEAHLSAAVDSADGGLNNGKTLFLPGESVYFLVWQSENVEHDMPIVSAGTVSKYAGGLTTYTTPFLPAEGNVPEPSITKEQDIQFADSDTGSLSIPSGSIVSTTWLGRSLGALTLQDDTVTVKASSKGVAVARVKSRTILPTAYKLVSPLTVAGLTDFSILVYISGRVVV